MAESSSETSNTGSKLKKSSMAAKGPKDSRLWLLVKNRGSSAGNDPLYWFPFRTVLGFPFTGRRFVEGSFLFTSPLYLPIQEDSCVELWRERPSLPPPQVSKESYYCEGLRWHILTPRSYIT